MNSLKTSLSLSLIAGLVATMLPAMADEIVVRRDTVVTPSYMAPIVVPAPTMTTTIVTPSSVCVPSTAIAPLATTTTTTTRKTTVSSIPSCATSSTSTTFTSDLGPIPVYSNRLAAMNDQINNALANGWITAAQANSLTAQHNQLADMITVRTTSRFDSDGLERGLNNLNLAIQDAMNSTRATAGLMQMQ